MDKTLVKGLRLLEHLARCGEPKGVSELSNELGLVKSNTHRLLMTLKSQGYVQKTPDSSNYELTSKLLELGGLLSSRLDLIKVARTYMVALENAVGETVHLSRLEGSEVIYIDKIEGSQPIKAYTTIGGRAPAWSVATGKLLLAHASPSTISDVTKRLKQFTERTIVKRDQFLKQLDLIRQAGFAVNQGEWRDGVSGIAAPIYNSEGLVIASVGISGPSTRFRHSDVKMRAPVVVDTARAISSALGFRRASSLNED